MSNWDVERRGNNVYGIDLDVMRHHIQEMPLTPFERLLLEGVVAIAERLEEIAGKDTKGKWQKCPVCEGRGHMVTPNWGFDATAHNIEVCNACLGKGIIPIV